MPSRDNILFWKYNWFGVADSQRNQLQSKISVMSQTDLEAVSFDEMANRLANEYALDPPTIIPADISIAKREVEIVRRRSNDFFEDELGSVQGVAIDVHLPFKGDKGMFNVKPTTFNYGPPHGIIRDDYIETTIHDIDNKSIKSSIESWIKDIQQYLDWQAKSAMGFTDELRNIAYQVLKSRLNKLKSDASLIDGLGFKIREK